MNQIAFPITMIRTVLIDLIVSVSINLVRRVTCFISKSLSGQVRRLAPQR